MPSTVLHLIHTHGAGGAETVILQLIEKLDPNRWRSVAAVPEDSWLQKELLKSPAEVVTIPSARAFDIPLVSRLWNVIRAHNVDLVHSHLFGPAVYGSLLGLARGLPVVSTIHGAVDLQVADKWWGIKKIILRRSGVRLVAVTEALQTEVAQQLGVRTAQVCVIPNGIDIERFSPRGSRSLREELGWTADEIILGAVGNVRRPKDYGTLLVAADRLRHRCPRCRFVIIGDTAGDPDLTSELLAERASLGLDDLVVFTGFRDDVATALQSFDVYVMSSSQEGLPLALLQAMAARLPIVATRCGGPDEFLNHEEDSLLVPTADPAALAAALEVLVTDEDHRHRLAAGARATVERRHALSRMTSAYERLYRKLLKPDLPETSPVEP